MSETIVRDVPLEQTRQLRQAILRAHETVDEMASVEPEGAVAAGAFEGEALLAVGLIGADVEPGAWRIRGMATVPEARGRGLGSAVLVRLLEHARRGGASRVWCNARSGAVSLYERHGFAKVSEELEIPPMGRHYVMELRLRQPAAEG